MDTIQAPHRSPLWGPEAVKHVSKAGWLGLAETEWRRGLHSSAMAPPNPYFLLRLRRISEGAARKAAAMANLGGEAPPDWWERRPQLDETPLSYELRPEGNRPGPQESWVRFDQAVAELSRVQSDESWSGEIEALSQLSLVIQEIVEDLEDQGTYPWVEDARRGDPEIREIPRIGDAGENEPDSPSTGVAESVSQGASESETPGPPAPPPPLGSEPRAHMTTRPPRVFRKVEVVG
jgi:hypothetical protein